MGAGSFCSNAAAIARACAIRPPSSRPNCLAPEAQWQPMSGRGQVFSFVVFHRAYHPAWEGKVPYTVALIELDEGPVMLSNVIGVDRTRSSPSACRSRSRSRRSTRAWPSRCSRRPDNGGAARPLIQSIIH